MLEAGHFLPVLNLQVAISGSHGTLTRQEKKAIIWQVILPLNNSDKAQTISRGFLPKFYPRNHSIILTSFLSGIFTQFRWLSIHADPLQHMTTKPSASPWPNLIDQSPNILVSPDEAIIVQKWSNRLRRERNDHPPPRPCTLEIRAQTYF